MRYTGERFEALFDKDVDLNAEQGAGRREWGRKLGHQAVGLYRTKRIVSGDYIEYEGYPVWQSQREASRAKKANPTEAAQRAQNEKDSRKKLVRLLNTNFTEADLSITLSYAGEEPGSLEQARKDMQNYLRRVKRWREKQGLPELKYVYIIEYLSADGRKKRVHHHVVMSGMDRDKAEELWGMGRANSHRLQPDDYGYEGLGRYVVKTKGKRPENEKAWTGSRNLKKPRVTVSDRRLTRKAIEQGITDENELRERIQRQEPGYIVNDISIKTSDYVPGAYVSVRLRRVAPRGSPPGDGPGKRRKKGDKG